MEAWQQRLFEERAELDAKVKKLQAFIASDKFKELDSGQQWLLHWQEDAMQTYGMVLYYRSPAED